MPKSVAVLHHERDKTGVMIVHMNDCRLVLPVGYPVTNGDLERSEPFDIVIIAINSLAIEQAIDINEIKIKAKLV